VLECLQRSLKIADVCMSSSMHVHLFVEILNQYLYYFENDNEVGRRQICCCGEF
jgi:vacuolar protein sorting-associated protein 35